jgi:hypothetical protein
MALTNNTGNRGAAAGKAAKPAAPKTTYGATVKTSGHPNAAAAHQAIHQATGKAAPAKPAAAAPATQGSVLSMIMQGQQPSAQQINQAASGYAQGTTQAAIQAGLGPLQSAAKTIQGTQTNVGQAYQGDVAQAVNTIKGLAGNQQSSAASLQNALAQSAQPIANQIDASGRAAAALANGYLSPQAAQMLAAQRTYTGTTQGAESQYLAGTGDAASGYLNSLAGNAAAMGPWGANLIQGTYGRQLTANQAAQNALINNQIARQPALRQSMAQQLATDYFTARGLGIKQQAATTGAKQAQTAATRVANDYRVQTANAITNRYTAKQKASYNAGVLSLNTQKLANTNAINNGKLALAQQVASWKQQYDTAIANARNLDAQSRATGITETHRHNLVAESQRWKELANQASKGGSAQNTSAIGKIYSSLYAYTSQLGQSYPAGKGYPAGTYTPDYLHRVLTSSRGINGMYGEAGYQLARFGYINRTVQAQLQNSGVTLPASWTSAQPTLRGAGAGVPFLSLPGLGGAPSQVP